MVKEAIRLAASLIVQQRSQGTDRILFLKRNSASSFRDAHVFPGGNVDSADYDPDWLKVCHPHDHQVQRLDKSLPLKITALRETFEECGLLLTKPEVKLKLQERLAWQRKVHDDPKTMIELCRQYGVKPAIDSLVHVGRWCTPAFLARRYDTHFFHYIYDEAEDQNDSVELDNVEIVSSRWLAPVSALEEGGFSFASSAHSKSSATAFAGKPIILHPPQIYLMASLAQDGHLESTDLETAAWTPEMIDLNGDEVDHLPSSLRDCVPLTLPGDYAHPTSSLPAPERPPGRRRLYAVIVPGGGPSIFGLEQRGVRGHSDFLLLKPSKDSSSRL